MLARPESYNNLVQEPSTFERDQLDQRAFEICIEKNYLNWVEWFVETHNVTLKWDMVRFMLANKKKIDTVRKCINLKTNFDPTSAGLEKIIFAGTGYQSSFKRSLKIMDILQIMLEHGYGSQEIIDFLEDYNKSGALN